MRDKQSSTDWSVWLRKARKAKDWTQEQMAATGGVKRTTYANYEAGTSTPPEELIARYLAAGVKPPAQEVGSPLFPMAGVPVPIPRGCPVPCSDWSDPLDADYEDFIEVDSFFAGKGRFACSIVGDSMYNLLHPGDLCIWQYDMVPKLGSVVIARSHTNEVTCAQLKHDGQQFILHKLNPRYEDAVSDSWVAIGYLVGVIRTDGSKRITVYDPNGIRP